MPGLLPYKIFLNSFKLVPRVSVSLVIENKKGEVLLAQRRILPGIGSWHLVGSFILKGETIQECITRVMKKELSLESKKWNATLMGVFDVLKKDPRGHVIELIYKIKTDKAPRPTKETKEVRFFRTLPRRIGFNHHATLKALHYK